MTCGIVLGDFKLSSLFGTVASLIIKHDIKVYKTEDTYEIANIIIELAEKIGQYLNNPDTLPSDYCFNVKITKASKLTPKMSLDCN